jgi:prepilin-type N-terminal cleavage/methylation domain-containing protein
MISFNSQFGLTIIEVIVAVAILGLMLGAVTMGFSSYADRQAFKQYIGEVELSIREQRQRTVASVEDTRYGVYVGPSTIEYYQGVSFASATASTTVQELPNNITATSSFSDGSANVTFTRLTGAASATGTITLFDQKINRTATITINALGLVE